MSISTGLNSSVWMFNVFVNHSFCLMEAVVISQVWDEALFFTIYISPVEYPSAVELIAGKLVDVKGIITHRFKLDEFEKALQTVDTAIEKTLKVVIEN